MSGIKNCYQSLSVSPALIQTINLVPSCHHCLSFFMSFLPRSITLSHLFLRRDPERSPHFVFPCSLKQSVSFSPSVASALLTFPILSALLGSLLILSTRNPGRVDECSYHRKAKPLESGGFREGRL